MRGARLRAGEQTLGRPVAVIKAVATAPFLSGRSATVAAMREQIPAGTASTTPFADLDAYVGLPRTVGLTLSPDGSRLVVGVSTIDEKRTGRTTALWEVDPTGVQPARRLTRSAAGESSAAFAADGSLLFTSTRPVPKGALPAPGPDDADAADSPNSPNDPSGDGPGEAPGGGGDGPPEAALWQLPAVGEARPLAARPGGISAVVAAPDAPVFAVFSPTLAAATDAADDARRRAARSRAKVTAILHQGYPVRYWDADLGPAGPRLLTAGLPDPGTGTEDAAPPLRDVTADAGVHGLRESSAAFTPDGTTLVTDWHVAEARGASRSVLFAIDVATGRRTTLADGGSEDPAAVVDFTAPAVSADGARVAACWESRSSASEPVDRGLALVPVDGSAPPTPVAGDWDRWPHHAVWSHDGSALFVTADSDFAGPVFRVPVDLGGERPGAGRPVRLTGDDAAYTDLTVAADGSAIYAMRSTWDSPPAPVRLDPVTPDQTPTPLQGPVGPPPVPGRLIRLDPVPAADGSPLQARLVLPAGADADHPAPPVLWVHGGPLASWNSWSWRWTPWVLAARGYAVLLPDPALSTGYGRDFVRRGHGRWGEVVGDDVLRATDAALARPDLDGTRTAMMGGSFGGYTANWLAGHTDRFDAIVSHAGLWSLNQFSGTTDGADYWRRELTAEAAARNDPASSADAITTPMLVIHGDRDYRVPIGEGLRLWADLAARATAADGSMPHRFLYFPDENHWILEPQHAVVWYATVLAFLDHHVRGLPWSGPELLD